MICCRYSDIYSLNTQHKVIIPLPNHNTIKTANKININPSNIWPIFKFLRCFKNVFYICPFKKL